MSLADRLALTARGLHGPVCSVCRLFTLLPDADAVTLRDALQGAYTSKQIAYALAAEGHDVSAATVARHRRGECRGAC